MTLGKTWEDIKPPIVKFAEALPDYSERLAQRDGSTRIAILVASKES